MSRQGPGWSLSHHHGQQLQCASEHPTLGVTREPRSVDTCWRDGLQRAVSSSGPRLLLHWAGVAGQLVGCTHRAPSARAMWCRALSGSGVPRCFVLWMAHGSAWHSGFPCQRLQLQPSAKAWKRALLALWRARSWKGREGGSGWGPLGQRSCQLCDWHGGRGPAMLVADTAVHACKCQRAKPCSCFTCTQLVHAAVRHLRLHLPRGACQRPADPQGTGTSARLVHRAACV